MRTLRDICNEINTHLSALIDLNNKIVSVHTISNDRPDCTGNGSQPKTVHQKRTRLELKFLIESGVDTFGTEISIKEFAEKTGIAESLLYRKPYSTYLENARKEYEKNRKVELAVVFTGWLLK
ncbi:MAG: hypothetical protein LBE12_20985 [Planctomycetaceae bacterium]|jgi:hypothetical protein|nr:hypothetical protein [Planctomycetaceae bacterium]